MLTRGDKRDAGYWCFLWVALSVACIAVLVLINGCALLLTGTTDPAKVEAIMSSTNARGCVYARASATPWASVVTYLVGSFGEPAPLFEDCWRALPPSSP